MVDHKPVPELDNQLRNVLKFSAFILAGVCLAVFIHPRDGVLWGLAIGLVTGMYNSVTLAKRIKRLPGLHPEAAKKQMKVSLAMRFGLIMAVLFLVSKKLPFVSLFGVGAGLLIPSGISVILSVIDTYKLYRQSEAFARKYFGE